MYKIGILGAADIAYRMFVPALKQCGLFECAGIAELYNKEKLNKFIREYELQSYDSFDELIENPEIDILYIPLPPAFHYEYAKKALLQGKHVFLEKPLTTNQKDAEELVSIARSKKLVLQENYMFQYHSQIQKVLEIIASKQLGEVRLMRGNFCFPKRESNDFRYVKKLGGGALLDAGGYVIKLGTLLLGEMAKISDAHLYYTREYEVDMFGDFSMSNGELTYQGAFGMDNQYNCSLEIIGSKGKLLADRIFTSPPEYVPRFQIIQGNKSETVVNEPDNHFVKSIELFDKALRDDMLREELYEKSLHQSRMVSSVKELGGWNND